MPQRKQLYLMKKWYLKAIIQKFISFLPLRNRINFFFQKYVTRGVDLNEQHFFNKFDHLCDHLEHFQQVTGRENLQGISCLELGTGWYPIIPLGYYLKGADKVYSVDISAHLTPATFLRCLEEMERYEDRIRESLGTIDENRWQLLQEIRRNYDTYNTQAEIYAQLDFGPIVADARQLQLEDNNIQLISSNNTYEHIYPEVLGGIIQRMWALLAPGGIMSHFIDMSDHFAHMDRGIDIYNFLRFSEKQWDLIDNRIQPQNRWRLQHYRELYQELDIPFAESKLREGVLEQVLATPLATPFAEMPAKEVAISHGYMISQKG